MGILVPGKIVERITGQRLPEVLRTELFEPLGMESTSLGWRDDLAGRVIWNTDYWRRLGSPWGGAFSNVSDLAGLFRLMLDRGQFQGGACSARAPSAHF